MRQSLIIAGLFVFMFLVGVGAPFYPYDHESGLGYYNKTDFDWMDARYGNFSCVGINETIICDWKPTNSTIDNISIWIVIDNETYYKLADGMSGENISIGTVADARIASTITRDTELISANNSVIFYSDTNDTLYNGSMKIYVLDVNDSMRIYVLGVNVTMDTYVDALNSTMTDLLAYFNISMDTYVDALHLAQNTTISIYVRDVNGTMKLYVDSQDTAFNNSMKEYADDTFVDESGDNMTGNLEMGTDANISDANSKSYFYWRGGGARILHLEM